MRPRHRLLIVSESRKVRKVPVSLHCLGYRVFPNKALHTTITFFTQLTRIDRPTPSSCSRDQVWFSLMFCDSVRRAFVGIPMFPELIKFSLEARISDRYGYRIVFSGPPLLHLVNQQLYYGQSRLAAHVQ